VAASRDAIVMVEGGADEITEDDLIEALMFAHRACSPCSSCRSASARPSASPSASSRARSAPDASRPACAIVAAGSSRRRRTRVKQERYAAFKAAQEQMAVKALGPSSPGEEKLIKEAFDELQYNVMRER
jgi:polyribonucleotide nucleotidyltransferase